MTMTPLRARGAAVSAALLTAALVLTGCSSTGDGSGTASGETRTVEAANGTVEVPVDPQRIVTIGNTSLPFIDIGGAPIGVTDVSASNLAAIPADQQATFAAATVVGSEGGEVDLEQLASLEPDLILVQFHENDWDLVGEQLESIAPTVLFSLDTEWKEFSDELAAAGNLTDNLTAQKTAFEDKVAQIQETYADVIANTSFVDISRGDWNDPGTFYIADIGCSEIARDDIGLTLPEAAEGEDPLAYASLPFEQLAELSQYDVITYPVGEDGEPTEAFLPVVETNTWTALPAVTSGHAVGVFCPGNNSYGPVLQYLDSLETALASLPAE